MVGSRYAMYIGAVLLAVGAVYVFLRGERQVVPADSDSLDEEFLALEGEGLGLEPALG
jgi:hypothetical protein